MPGVTPHPGSLPSGCIPAGRLTDPHAGRTDRRREARNGRSTAPRLSGDRRRQCRGRVDMTKRVSRGRSRGRARPRSHAELLPRRRRVGRPHARLSRVPRRAIPHQHITELGRQDGRPCGAPVPPASVATFAHARAHAWAVTISRPRPAWTPTPRRSRSAATTTTRARASRPTGIVASSNHDHDASTVPATVESRGG